jgi:hypothetical protein
MKHFPQDQKPGRRRTQLHKIYQDFNQPVQRYRQITFPPLLHKAGDRRKKLGVAFLFYYRHKREEGMAMLSNPGL